MDNKSRQKLKEIRGKVHKIRSVTNNALTDKEIQKYRKDLDKYSAELRKLDKNGITHLEVVDITKIINETKEQMLPMTNTDKSPPKGFKRWFSGNFSNQNKNKNNRVKDIQSELYELTKLIYSGRTENQENVQQKLINYSQELSKFRNKSNQREIEEIQKIITSASGFLIQQGNQEEAKRMNEKKSQPQLTRVQNQQKAKPKQLQRKSNINSLDDIEIKLQYLNEDIERTEFNKDIKSVNYLTKSIESLMVELQMVEVQKQKINEGKKIALEKKLKNSYQRVTKMKNQMRQQDDLNYLTDLKQKKNQEKLKELEDIFSTIKNIRIKINQQNFETNLKNTFNHCKNKFDSIEENNEEIRSKKSEISGHIAAIENVFNNLEKITEAEGKYRELIGNHRNLNSNEKYQELSRLKQFVLTVVEVHQKVDEMKKNLIKKINDDLRITANRMKLANTKQASPELLVTCGEEMKKLLNEYNPESYHQNQQQIQSILMDVKILIEKKLRLPEAIPQKKENSRSIEAHEIPNSVPDKVNNLHRESISGAILGDIMSIDNRINDLGNKIRNIEYTTKDHDTIRRNLLEHEQYLKNLEIPYNRPNILKSRDDLLKQIQTHLFNLDQMKHQNSIDRRTRQEKEFNQKFRNVQEKVKRFSGHYKNVLYKTIENELDSCLGAADKVFKDKNISGEVKKEIENYKLILEQKSTKEQSATDPKLKKIKEDLSNVRKRLEVPNLSNEELNRLETRLTLTITDLDKIKSVPLTDEQRQLYKEIHSYFDRIGDLQKSIEEQQEDPRLKKIKADLSDVKRRLEVPNPNNEELDRLEAFLTLIITELDKTKSVPLTEEQKQLYLEIHSYFNRTSDLRSKKQTNKDDAVAQIIRKLEEKFEKMKPEIRKFVGLETSQKYFELDETMIQITLALDNLKLDKNSDLHSRKINLLREIQNYNDILDERVNQTEEVENMEKQIKEMLIKIDSFNGYFQDGDYNDLDEQIINLNIKLNKMTTNQELIPRMDNCARDINLCMKKLKDAAKLNAGTLV